MKVVLLVFALMSSIPIVSSAQSFVDEPVRVRKHRNAPIELRLIRSWVKACGGSEWADTCVELSVLVRTTETIDSFSYRIGVKDKMPSVLAKRSMPDNGSSIVQCVPNRRGRNEKQFIIRLDFVEGSGRTLWESRRHRKEVEKLFRGFRIPTQAS